MESSKTNWRTVVFAAVAIVAFFFAAQIDAATQEQKRVFMPGEVVEIGGEFYKIFQCRVTGIDEECEVIVYDKNNQPTSHKMWMRANTIRGGEALFKERKQIQAAQERFDAKRASGTFAVTAQPKFEPGEYLDVGGDAIYEINECRNPGKNAECLSTAFVSGRAANVRLWERVSDLRAHVEQVRRAKAREAGNNVETANADNGGNNAQPTRPAQTNNAKQTPPAPANDAKPRGAATECSFEPPAPKYSNSDPFSANLAKRAMFDVYGWSANGTLSAPLRVGVVYLSFQTAKPYRNIVRTTVRGAERLNDAAPPNAMIYPVNSKHIVCEEYRSGVQRRQIESEYDCFKNRQGEWVCGSSGKLPPKITQLQ